MMSVMKTTTTTLEGVQDASGVVVVIDVLRAFTLGALALAAGAVEVRCVRTTEEALQLRDESPGALAMGEHHRGHRVPGFDLGNSPTELAAVDVAGARLVHRSSAGTQGLVAAAAVADHLFAASFVCAGATARAVAALAPERVTFVATGVDERDGEEDLACADYLTELLHGRAPEPGPYLARIRSSDAGRLFGTEAHLPASDLEHATRLDAVDFALRAETEGRHPVLRAHRVPAG